MPGVNRVPDVDAARLENTGNLRKKWQRGAYVFHDHEASDDVERLIREGHRAVTVQRTKPINMFQVGVSHKVGAPNFALRRAMAFQESVVAATDVEQFGSGRQVLGDEVLEIEGAARRLIRKTAFEDRIQLVFPYFTLEVR
jgi:hypothetical protein